MLLGGCSGSSTSSLGFSAVPSAPSVFAPYSDVSLTVPAGAVPSPVQFTFAPRSAAGLPTTFDGAAVHITSQVYTIGPAGQQFAAGSPATLALAVTTTQTNAITFSPFELRIFTIVNGSWQPVTAGWSVNPISNGNQVTGSLAGISSSGTYAVLAIAPPTTPVS